MRMFFAPAHLFSLFFLIAFLGDIAVAQQTQEDYTDPAVQHEQLAKYQGKWQVALSMGSGDDALKFDGTATSEMTIGGRFLQIDYETKSGPQPMNGTFILGFDRRNSTYQLISMDSWGTYILSASGKRQGEDTIKLTAKDDDPLYKSMGFEKVFAYTVTFTGKDQFSIDVYLVDNRTEKKSEIRAMAYTFTHKK